METIKKDARVINLDTLHIKEISGMEVWSAMGYTDLELDTIEFIVKRVIEQAPDEFTSAEVVNRLFKVLDPRQLSLFLANALTDYVDKKTSEQAVEEPVRENIDDLIEEIFNREASEKKLPKFIQDMKERLERAGVKVDVEKLS